MSELDLRPFDFTASKIPSMLMDCMRTWQKKFASLVDDQLFDLTACPVETKTELPSLKTFSDLQSTWNQPTYGLVAQVEKHDFPIAVISPRDQLLQFSLAILGQETSEVPDRELTSAELSLAQVVFEQVLDSYGRSWPQIDPLEIAYQGMDPKMSQARVFHPDAEVLMLESITSHAGGGISFGLLCPRANLEQILDLQPQAEDGASNANTKLSIDSLSEVAVTVRAALKTVALMSELKTLSVGDIVTFDQKIDHPIPISANEETLYLGWPGKVGIQQSIKIDSVA